MRADLDLSSDSLTMAASFSAKIVRLRRSINLEEVRAVVLSRTACRGRGRGSGRRGGWWLVEFLADLVARRTLWATPRY